ncbi:MAG: hypothetical protein CL908_21975 [Deltaproteobacteria bacterium]|jgi:hypothetical protein|nr:hypothetical protein [Deltaproteobacteria bacterium]
MRRFLTVFICLSTLALAQNVVAASPAPTSDPAEILLTAERADAGELVVASGAAVGGEMPTPTTMMLLVTGLAGLTAAGGRRRVGERANLRHGAAA